MDSWCRYWDERHFKECFLAMDLYLQCLRYSVICSSVFFLVRTSTTDTRQMNTSDVRTRGSTDALLPTAVHAPL